MKFGIMFILLGLLCIVPVSSSLVSQPLQADAKAWIGVTVQTVDRSVARENNLDLGQGALVTDVITDSPADRAGLREGDVIVRFDGRNVNEAGDVVRIADRYRPGDRVSIEISRDNDRRQLSFTFGDISEYRSSQRGRQTDRSRNNETAQRGTDQRGRTGDPDVSMRDRNRSQDRSGATTGSFLGIRMQELNDQLADFLGVNPDDGVLVVEVIENSPAGSAGIRAGDILQSVGNQRINSPTDVQRLIAQERPGSSVDIQVIRDRRPRTVSVALSGDLSRWDQDNVPDPYHHPEMYGGTGQNPETESLRREVEELREIVEDLQQSVDELERRGD